jgi:exosortase
MSGSESNPDSKSGFVAELGDFVARLPDKGMFVLLLGLWLGLFHFLGNSTLGYVDTASLFAWMDYSYGNRVDDEHGYLIPLLVLTLLWWNKDELAVIPKRVWWPGLILLAFSLALHVVGFQVQQARISIVAFFAGGYALMGILWGPQWLRATFFPWFLFAFSVPLGSMSDTLSQPLRILATNITVVIANVGLGVEVIQKGTSVLNPDGKFSYEVAAACSGLRSLTAILALSFVFAFLWFKSWWRRGLVVLLAFPLAVASNVVRLTTIIVAADIFGQDAGNFVHDNGVLGLLPYLPALAGLFFLGWLLRENRGPRNSRAKEMRRRRKRRKLRRRWPYAQGRKAYV